MAIGSGNIFDADMNVPDECEGECHDVYQQNYSFRDPMGNNFFDQLKNSVDAFVFCNGIRSSPANMTL